MKSSIWIVIGVVIITLFILGISLWVLYDYKNHSKTVHCTTQNCPSGQFCNAAGVCVNGSAGPVGASCPNDNACNYGLICQNNICTAPAPPPTIPYFLLYVSTVGGSKYYISFDSQLNGIMTFTRPSEFRFSFDLQQPNHINFVAPNNQSPYYNRVLGSGENGFIFASEVLNIDLNIKFTSDYSTVQIANACGQPLVICLSSNSASPAFPASSNLSCPGITTQTCSYYQPVLAVEQVGF